jgi:hypothetical protein
MYKKIPTLRAGATNNWPMSTYIAVFLTAISDAIPRILTILSSTMSTKIPWHKLPHLISLKRNPIYHIICLPIHTVLNNKNLNPK